MMPIRKLSPIPSTPYLPLPEYQIFIGGQSLETHGPPRMELLGADAYLRAEAEFSAVAKSC